jgi:hypothetical protein
LKRKYNQHADFFGEAWMISARSATPYADPLNNEARLAQWRPAGV